MEPIIRLKNFSPDVSVQTVKHINATVNGFSTHVSATVKDPDGRINQFGETEREGRTSQAKLLSNGNIEFRLTGTSPQNEEDTHLVCQTLVSKLNTSGSNWTKPVEGKQDADCVCTDQRDSKIQLQIQVIRALADPRFWRDLNQTQDTGIIEVDVKNLIENLAESISKKGHKIPMEQQSDIVLALDANRLPHFTLNPVYEEFKRLKFELLKNLGFHSIWIVGPIEALTNETRSIRFYRIIGMTNSLTGDTEYRRFPGWLF